MDFLLDTHTLIWMMEDDPRLPTPVANLLTDETHELWLSAASFWEISIKRSLGKLNLSYSTNQYWSEAARQGIRRLPIELNHLLFLEQLPFHHRDPFDRLLIAQAQAEGLTVLTRDARCAI